MMGKSIGNTIAPAIFAALIACTESAGPGGTLPALTHDPILFVHGYLGSNSNFDVMRQHFVADGWKDYELYAYNAGILDSNAKAAAEIRDKVNQIIAATGATKVDIIAHSMGSISSRYYLKNFAGTEKVDAWVSLAGPNHGTDYVDRQNCQTTPCREIAIGSSFLDALNSGDETPGLTRYATWRSTCDTTINPTQSVVLLGATNTLSTCVVHFNFLLDETVYQQVKAFVE
jgi:triacylglycerol lipase